MLLKKGKITKDLINMLDGTIVYDNQLGALDGAEPTTVLGGGSIVIHK
jgi:hypothetical protein